MTCDRCEKRIKKADAVPVVYGNTDMTICYPCAVELTLLIGHWLGTEPMADPVAWFVNMKKKRPTVMPTEEPEVELEDLAETVE